LPQQVQVTLEECFDEIRFARAVDLARSRRFMEAEALMSARGELPQRPRDLDLLARIAAQQKQFEKARRCWELARENDPQNHAYDDGLRAIAIAETALARWKKVAIIGVSVAALVTVIMLAGHYWPWARPSPPKPTIQQPQPPSTGQQKVQPAPVGQPQPPPQKKATQSSPAPQKR
jgi:hypothetical protein